MPSIRRLITATAALAVNAACGFAQDTRACTEPPALDSTALMRDVFRLAHDSMGGRRVGTPGNAKARDFIAARFDALRLETLGGARIDPFVLTRRGRGADAQTTTVPAANVIGMVRGTRFPNRYIVISAHFDHIGVAGDGSCRAIGADSVCNGADDDASGTAAVLQLAEHFTRNRPAHSIIFAAFDAEESGLAGARAWVDSMPVPADSVLLNVNMDMIGRNEKHELFASGPTKWPHLAPLVNQQIACTRKPLILISGHDGEPGRDDWTGMSDQGAFHRRGIPFVYFGEEDHPDYHRAGDHPDRLMAGFYVAAARTVADFVRRFDANPVAKPR